MNWRFLGAVLFGGAFQIVNFLALLLTSVRLRFSAYQAQMFSGDGNFLIPGGHRSGPFDTMDSVNYRSLPFVVAGLLLVSSACPFAHVRLAK